jgi:hypothetical protein
MNTKFELLLALAVGACIGTAQAVPTLYLDDGHGHTATITDGGVGDFNSLPGAVSYSGALGNWILNVSTGVTKPALGSAAQPMMDLNSVNLAIGGGNTLNTMKIVFTESGFLSPGLALAGIGGTSDGSVSYKTYVNGVPLTTQSFNGNPFSGSSSGLITVLDSYSLTQEIDITKRGAGITSFNAAISVPDGGMTAALLGFALVGVEGWRRKMANRA